MHTRTKAELTTARSVCQDGCRRLRDKGAERWSQSVRRRQSSGAVRGQQCWTVECRGGPGVRAARLWLPRLLPGLDVLIPAASDDMDSYLLNLFAIKHPRWLSWKRAGLIRPPPPSTATRSGASGRQVSTIARHGPRLKRRTHRM